MSSRTLFAITAFVAACGSDDSPPIADVSQTPPMGRDAIEAWLADGAHTYKTWAAEPTVHAARAPSPHGFNRIFSNDLIANNVTGSGEWPEGVASVKELYASATATTPFGVSVYLKLAPDSAGGANWYWYERFDSNDPQDDGVVADGIGSDGAAKDICVGCHIGAGSDAQHTPSPGGRDQVYTPVR